MASDGSTGGAERLRLPRPTRPRAVARWGPYLAERAWGTVREDYSATAPPGTTSRTTTPGPARTGGTRTAWPASATTGRRSASRSRFWNGRDPILKERMFGLGGDRGQPRRGRQGVLVVPRLHADPLVDALALPLPAGRVPVRRPGRGERTRGRHDPEYELVDTGVFDDDRYWAVDRRLRQGRDRRLCMRGHASTNPGPSRRRSHVLPTLWFRNTWAWGSARPRAVPISVEAGHARRRAPRAGPAACSSGDGDPEPPVLRQRDQRRAAVRASRPLAVPEGRHQRPRRPRRRDRQPGPGRHQGRAALRLTVASRRAARTVRLPSSAPASNRADGHDFDAVMTARGAPRPTRSSPR